MKKEGYSYFPVSPPKEATPGFVFPAFTPADFSQLGKHGYGLARSFETAVHHEQTDQNSVVIKAFSDYAHAVRFSQDGLHQENSGCFWPPKTSYDDCDAAHQVAKRPLFGQRMVSVA